MSDNCTSSPVSGCTDGQSIASLQEFTDNFSEHLVTINLKKGAVLIQIDDCCENINGKLTDIKDILENIKNQAVECCTTTNSNLDDVLSAIQTIINGGGPCDTDTTTEHDTPVTTQEPEPPLTTDEPDPENTTTSTEEDTGVKSGTFDLDSDSDFICALAAEVGVTLYYDGSWSENNTPDAINLVMFRDEGLTQPVNESTSHTFIKRNAGDKIYTLNEAGLAGDYVSTCEV